MNIPTPAERLEIYEKMLPYFEGEKRLIDNVIIHGLCDAIEVITKSDDITIRDFPELSKHKPVAANLYWFLSIDKGPDHTRTAILHQAISEVKKLINEPSIL